MHQRLLPLALAGALTVAGAAAAEPARAGAPPTPAEDPAPGVTDRPPSAFRHDGFYFRFGTGFGAVSESLRSSRAAVYGGRVEGNTSGLATLGELAFGGTLAPGLALGGGVYTFDIVTATFRGTDDSASAPPRELDPARRNFALVGPFVDWYFDDRSGFHAQLALGIASLSVVELDTSPVEDEPYGAIGGGIMLGIGYEWWVAEEWSLGVMARTTAAFLVGKDESDVTWHHALGSSPGPMFTVTYH